jgi:hypothetical protein
MLLIDLDLGWQGLLLCLDLFTGGATAGQPRDCMVDHCMPGVISYESNKSSLSNDTRFGATPASFMISGPGPAFPEDGPEVLQSLARWSVMPPPEKQ